MANSVWLSSYVCPVARAVTPVRVWCMMKRSWLGGQLTILTSIPHAPFAALRFCLCSMWTSETWVTRKGNLVCNHTIDIFMETFTISNCFLFILSDLRLKIHILARQTQQMNFHKFTMPLAYPAMAKTTL